MGNRINHRINHKRNAGGRFLLARKDELSQRQKDVIVDFVVREMLGEKVASDLYELEGYLEEESESIDQTMAEKLQASVQQGCAVYSGLLPFQNGAGTAALLKKLWNALEQADATGFVQIDTDL